jgi:hypothetical protein
LGLAHDASARVQRTDVPIATRVGDQNAQCKAFDGTPSTTTNPQTGSVSTSCQGGEFDGRHCINTAKITECHIDRVLPPGGGGNGASGYGGVVSAEPGGSAVGQTGSGSGQTLQATAASSPHSHHTAQHRHAGRAHGK